MTVQRTMFTTQSTTISPSKYRPLHTAFSKTTLKNTSNIAFFGPQPSAIFFS
jgi:hypothetical protein